ncbi:Gfo/Idh/MocA family protein [Streptomyces sp. VRA16 Mangrove soil]|uniref:Gfo/Idh/MocA family protein n=1 Tax=Streptomyces sp. VRA16 Mangrove soil TaxID=2817434 RepID=UPI001A9D8EDE|nr:Gfo/Idh/MocA family oxidoreductase [Streptomyces sp. VRA16 Mangrove soil]MBO1332169.1 Gfo/Idh/MocA family oxidoreductase [Streptomyces sp. VRA16 Mangrove soil]
MARLDVGLIGAGGIARAHLPAWTALGARVTILSTDGNAERLAAEHRDFGVTATDSLPELLDRCTVADVCTPTFTHRELTLDAIAAGKHVVCEKPLALSVAEAREMADAAETAGVLLFPAHVVRYFPAYAALADDVAAGRVGTPAVLRFSRSGRFPVWAPWFADPALSGGILVDQMIHDLDFARLLAGEVVRVHARVRGHQGPGAQNGDVTTGTAVLTHASGAISHVLGVWGPPDLPFRTTFRVAGPGGILEHDSTAQTGFRVLAQGRRPLGEGIPGSPMTESPYLTELREFAAAVAGGPAPRVSARDGVEAVRIAVAAAESARTGEPVELKPTEEAGL